MNVWTWIFLGALVALWLVDLLAGYLNLRALESGISPEFQEIHDPAYDAKLSRYTAINTRFGALESGLVLLLLACFWLAGGFEFLDQQVRRLGWGVIPTGLAYLALLWLGSALIALPFNLWHTFVIEERFGFNKTSTWTFIADRLKGLVLGLVLGGSILALLLALLERAGAGAWLWAWGAISAAMLLFTFLAPAVILPLFNKFTPLPEGPLKDGILRYARDQKFPVAEVVVMDGSKRSTRANAFFTGFGRTRKIVLFDTLIAEQSVPELVAILAHEIGHYKMRHLLQHLAVAIAHLGLFLFLASVFLREPAMFQAFGVKHVSVYVGLALFSILYGPLSRLFSIGLGLVSRRHEYQADAFAARTTGRPEDLITALKKLARNNLAHLSPHPLYVLLHHSHPPVLQRVKALRQLA